MGFFSPFQCLKGRIGTIQPIVDLFLFEVVNLNFITAVSFLYRENIGRCQWNVHALCFCWLYNYLWIYYNEMSKSELMCFQREERTGRGVFWHCLFSQRPEMCPKLVSITVNEGYSFNLIAFWYKVKFNIEKKITGVLVVSLKTHFWLAKLNGVIIQAFLV